MEDSMITELYWQRDERALTETAEKYGGYCLKIAGSILNDEQDSEECVNDTWLYTWRAIPPQRPTVLRLFLAKITRNLAFSRYRIKYAQKRGAGEIAAVLSELSECVAGSGGADTEVFAKELGASVDSFLRTLPQRERALFIGRYFYNLPGSTLAEKHSLSENNVSVILSRIRKKLKHHLIKEGYVNE